MWQFLLGGLCFLGIMMAIHASAPDYRPKFDKSIYKGTIWTQVNPWWIPSKQRIDDSGGPNYSRKKHAASSPWGDAMADSFKYGRLNWQVELHIPAPAYANTMKKMIKEAKEEGIDAKFSIFLVYYGKKGKLDEQVKKTVSQCKRHIWYIFYLMLCRSILPTGGISCNVSVIADTCIGR